MSDANLQMFNRALEKALVLDNERLRTMLRDLARAADTAELLLRKDYPAEAASLRAKVEAVSGV